MQAPLNNTLKDYQNLILSCHIDCVLMLCNRIQNGKIKCHDYLQHVQKQPIQSKNTALQINKIKQPQQYIHLHYTQWLDHSVPQNMNDIDDIIQEVSKFKNIAIHCSAGLGRSGVIAAIIFLVEKVKNNSEFSIFDIVWNIRENRYGAIQTLQQYTYIYHYARHLWQLKQKS